MILLRFFIVSVIASALLIASSPVITYIQTVNKYPIPFDKLGPSFSSFKIYYAELEELPKQMGENSYYYSAKIDGHRIVLKMYRGLYRSVERELEENGSAWVHGTINLIDKDETSRTEFVQNSYRYLDCIDGSLYYEMTQAHPIGMVFGITWLIVAAMGMHLCGTLNMFKHLRPACGSTRYSVKEIDAEANMPDAVWLSSAGIYLAPKIMIGTQKGMTAVGYGEIARVSIKAIMHFQKFKHKRHKPHSQYYEYHTYQITVKTKRGKRLKFADSKRLAMLDMNKLYEKILEHSPDAEIDDPNSKYYTKAKSEDKFNEKK